jgi:GH24 family phage-related lysozyme (muramidase)
MSITPNEISRVKRYEGNTNFLYLDINGNPTIGYGHLVPDSVSAAALPFLLNAGNTAATPLQKQTEWTTIKSKPFGKTYPASYYSPFCTMHLQQSDIDNLLTSDLTSTEQQLSAFFSNYSQFPQPAKEGLVDMAYTQGVRGLSTGFPNFVAAVKILDWATAANECNRPQLAAARNLEVKNLFLSVAKPVTPTRPGPTGSQPGSGSTGTTHPPLAIRPWLDRIPVPSEPAPQRPETAQAAAAPPPHAIRCPADVHGIVAIVAMNSNISAAAITAITAIATRK